MNWQTNAKNLYFTEHLRISEVADKVGISRQSVSAFLKACPEWDMEKEFRRNKSEIKRKKDKAKWDRENRSVWNDDSTITYCVMREHAQAVAELSRERY